jgi:hypothetical protein
MAKNETKLRITGSIGPNDLEKIRLIEMGDEIGGGKVVAILWYRKFRCAIVTETKEHYNIHLYKSDTIKTILINTRKHLKVIYTYKILLKSKYDLKDILSKFVLKIR